MGIAILVSVKKGYLDKIKSEDKVLEVRKNFPRVNELPCPILFYETLTSGGCGKIVAYGYLTDYTLLTHEQLKFMESRTKDTFEILGGYIHDFMTKSCLSKQELLDYANRKGQYVNLYGWHLEEIHTCSISLESLGITRAPQSWCKVDINI
jgi:hypothetical protein